MAEIWITKNGTKMKMSEMTSGHLMNALRYFKIKQKEEPFKKLMREAKRRNLNVDDIVNPKIEEIPIESRWEILDIRDN